MDSTTQERGRTRERTASRRERYSSVDRRDPESKAYPDIRKTVVLFGEATFDFAAEYARKPRHRKYTIIATEYRSLDQVLDETEAGDEKLLLQLEQQTHRYRTYVAAQQAELNSGDARRSDRAAKELAQYLKGNAVQGLMVAEYQRLLHEKIYGTGFGRNRVLHNLALLKKLGATVLFGIDATKPDHWHKIKTCVPFGHGIDLVQWNDPHGNVYGEGAGDFENLLMTGFFKNADAFSVGKAKVTVIGYPYLAKPKSQGEIPVNLLSIAHTHAPSLLAENVREVTPSKYTFKPQRTIGGTIDPLKDYNQLKKFVFTSVAHRRQKARLHILNMGRLASEEEASFVLQQIEKAVEHVPSKEEIHEWMCMNELIQ